MAVLVEAISVIVRRDAVEAHFNGGMQAFLRAIPTAAACNDDDLIRIGFMDPTDAGAYVASLAAEGMTTCSDGVAIDLVVVDQKNGPAISVPWLEFKRIETNGMKLSICWLAGQEPSRIAIPAGWTYERSLSASGPRFMSTAVIGDRLKFLRRENGVEVYLDLQTNKELYTARPRIGGDTPVALQTQISAMVHESLAIEAEGPVPPSRRWSKPDSRYKKLNSELLPEIDRIAKGAGKEMMSAHFARGVILRLLRRLPEAELALRKANELKPGTLGVLRDLVRCIAEQRKPREALPFAREAASIDPADESVLGNLAACLMQCGEDEESLQVIARALEINPNDEINVRIRDTLLRRQASP